MICRRRQHATRVRAPLAGEAGHAFSYDPGVLVLADQRPNRAHHPVPGLGGADAPDSPATLDLRAAGITSVVWATGYGWDLAWLPLPVLDAAGAPRNVAGMSPCAGLYFAGMSVVDPLSTSIGRVGAEAERIVATIAVRAAAHA
jgi:hypothetical protein